MDFEDLRNVRMREKDSSKLSELPQGFYRKTEELISEEESEKKVKNLKSMIKDIFKRREQKINRSALRAARTDEKELENLTEEEKELYEALIDDLTDHRTLLKQVINQESEEKNETNKNQEEKKDTLVRTLEKIPKFTDSESNEHGPFQPQQLVRIPTKEAKILKQKELIEEVEK